MNAAAWLALGSAAWLATSVPAALLMGAAIRLADRRQERTR